MEAWTCWLASAFTVVESAVCIVISDWFNDDCDCWLLLVSLPPPTIGCDDDDCPALDGASFGLRGNKLAFSDGCIANSEMSWLKCEWRWRFWLQRSIGKNKSSTNLAPWSWTMVEIRVRSVKPCCLPAARWRKDGRKLAMALSWRRACTRANVTLMQSLLVAYALGIPENWIKNASVTS